MISSLCIAGLIFGCESWLSPSVHNAEVFPPNFNIYRRDREDGYGGVFIACHNTIVSHEIPYSGTQEVITCKIKLSNTQSLIACSVYRPPNRSIDYIEAICSTLESIILSSPNDIIWIAGDFNLPDINWTDSNIIGSNYPLSVNSTFLDFVNTFGLTQTVDFPTRLSNTLDIFLTNRPSLINYCTPIAGISDHEAVLTESNISIFVQKQPRRKIYLWNRADSSLIRNFFYDFSNEYLHSNTTDTPINQLWTDFKSACHFCLDTLVPSKLSSNKASNRPWITTYIKRICRRKKRAYAQYRRTRSPAAWQYYKTLKNLAQKECRQAYNDYFSKLIDSSSTANSKKLWLYIKKQKLDHVGIPPLSHNGHTITDSTHKANILNDYFSSVFTTEDTQCTLTPDESPYLDIQPISITYADVSQLLTTLDVHKAPGPDKIPSHLLQLASQEIAPVLTLIINSSLHQGELPMDWKSANIVPVFKKGDKTLASNYRPISLTSISCKIMERLIHTHLFSHLESINILCDQQHGFRPRRSCESQLITTVNNISKSLDSGFQIDIIFLDLSKAFDKVPHHRLCNKLSYYGIRGELLTWLQNFLIGRHQQVTLDGSTSESHAVNSGVPQGTILALYYFYVILMTSHYQSMPTLVCMLTIPYFILLFTLHPTVYHFKMISTPYHNGALDLVCFLILIKVYS